MSRPRLLLLACLVAPVAALHAPHTTSAQPPPKARKVASFNAGFRVLFRPD